MLKMNQVRQEVVIPKLLSIEDYSLCKIISLTFFETVFDIFLWQG